MLISTKIYRSYDVFFARPWNLPTHLSENCLFCSFSFCSFVWMRQIHNCSAFLVVDGYKNIKLMAIVSVAINFWFAISMFFVFKRLSHISFRQFMAKRPIYFLIFFNIARSLCVRSSKWNVKLQQRLKRSLWSVLFCFNLLKNVITLKITSENASRDKWIKMRTKLWYLNHGTSSMKRSH